MNTRLYVGNLAYSTMEQTLRDTFAQYGEVVSATVIVDRMSGRSRGFGFVEFANPNEAQAAVDALNGAMLEGRPLVVNIARERQAGGGGGGGRGFSGDRRSGGGGGGGGGGGAGGGRGGGGGGGGGGRGGGRDRRRERDDEW